MLMKKYFNNYKFFVFLNLSFLLVSCADKDLSIEKEINSNNKTIYKTINNKKANLKYKFNINNENFIDTSLRDVLPDWQTKKVFINANNTKLQDVVNALTKQFNIHNVFMQQAQDKSFILLNTLPVTMHYQGNVIEALKIIAIKNNINYTFDKKTHTIYWSYWQTKNLLIAHMPGSTDFKIGNKTNSTTTNKSSSGDSSNNSGVSDDSSSMLSGNINIWNELNSSIQKLLTSEGRLDINQTTSTITVTDRPNTVNTITKLVNSYNKILSKRVLIKIQILEIQLNKSHSYGVNWNAIYQYARASINFNNNNTFEQINSIGQNISGSSASGLGIQIFKGGFANSTALFSALDTQGKINIVTEPTVVSLNNQPNKIAIGGNQGYIKSTTVTVSGTEANTTSTSFEPGTIDTGVNITIIPHIQQDKIYMSLDAQLTNLLDIQSVSSKSGDTQIQLPKTDYRTFNQRIMVSSGNTIILSGFKIKNSGSNLSKNFRSKLLGNNTTYSDNAELIVLITPIIIKSD